MAAARRVADKMEWAAQAERELRFQCQRRRVGARVQQRTGAMPPAAKGRPNKEFAGEARLDLRQVARWKRRGAEGGVHALLQDAPCARRMTSATAEIDSRILGATFWNLTPTAGRSPTRQRHAAGRLPRAGFGCPSVKVDFLWARRAQNGHQRSRKYRAGLENHFIFMGLSNAPRPVRRQL